MFNTEIDRKPYEPERVVQYPYIATTRGGKVVIVLRESDDDENICECLIIREGLDALTAGDMHTLDKENLVALAEGESVSLYNIWETANG